MSNRPFRPAGHPCDALCRGASVTDAEVCICECGGAQHGADHRRPVYVSTPESQARAFARLPVPDDEEW